MYGSLYAGDVKHWHILTMKFILKTFDELSNVELFAIYRLRAEVFVVEQNCAYQDVDEKDLKAHHLLLYNEEHLLAYCRILGPKTAYPNAAIGRVVVAPLVRGRGYGKLLMKEAIERTALLFGKHKISISAQTYLRLFYEGLGFLKTGKEYLEDNIPHMEMEYTFVKT